MLISSVVRKEYGHLPRNFVPEFILDGGAYIGDTSAFFASLFPQAQVLAVEAAAGTAQQARLNLQPYGTRIRVVEAALWSEDSRLRFGGASTAARVSESGEEVRAVSVSSLLAESGWERIDLLKLDVEGAELEVLRAGQDSWLQDVKCVLVEIHGPELERQVLPLLESCGFVYSKARGVWIAVRPDTKPE